MVGLLAAGILLDLRFWTWPWARAASLLDDHLLFVLFAVPALLVAAAPALLRRRAAAWTYQSRAVIEEPKCPWLLSYPGVGIVVALVATVGVVALMSMMSLASSAVKGAQPGLQIEVIKSGLGLFAASGAVAALLLALRRQRHVELAQVHTELDATERRFTDLYTKAVEQLGSADAAVRLGGLYALERAAQNDIGQRQTIVNVLCAYLRMPYQPPVAAAAVGGRAHEVNGDLPVELPLGSGERQPQDGRDAKLEFQVRLTAQGILTLHLTCPLDPAYDMVRFCPPSRTSDFWPFLDIDLTGATLIDWALPQGYVSKALFENAVFVGRTVFDGVAFAGEARFGGARFDGEVRFDDAVFHGVASFADVRFAEPPSFNDASAESQSTRSDVWPPGWRLGQSDSRFTKLVHE